MMLTMADTKVSDTIICRYCPTAFLTRDSLRQHAERIHKKTPTNIEGNPFNCESCSKAFQTRNALRRHARRIHRAAKFKCYYCNFTTKFKYSLANHVSFHLEKKEIRKGRGGAWVKCPFCEFGCLVRETMIDHYVNEHDMVIKEQNLELPSMEEFLKWKYHIEQTDICRFICSSGKKNRGDTLVQYYRCFRDGIYQPEGRGIRNVKLNGSLKINGICPAGIKAEECRTSGAVRVTFIRSHVGHSNELGLINLSKSERAEFAQKLAMGMTHDEILSSLRESVDATNIRRVHLTTRKDLWNVECSYGIGKNKKRPVKANKPDKKEDQTIHGQCRIDIPGSGRLIMTETPQTDVRNVVFNTEATLDRRPQNRCSSMETSGSLARAIQSLTVPQDPGGFQSDQSVPDETNLTQISDDLVIEHTDIVACENPNDKDHHYFVVSSPDRSDSGQLRLKTSLNEKKLRIRSEVEELLVMITTDEQADILYNEFLRVKDNILAQSSVSGHSVTSS